MANIKVFNKWDCAGIEIKDPGLKGYISLNATIVPKTGAKYAGNRFHKSKTFIVERLINRMMVAGHKGKKHKISSGHTTGKGIKSYNLVKDAFEIVEKRLKKNPMKVFVKAVENAAPREEIVAIEYGGARYPKAVECAPQRRVDTAIKMMAQGSYSKTFKSKRPAADCLANEIINAYNMSQNSNAISKKLELERQADASK